MATITANALAILMIGSTHYVDTGQERDAVIYYPSETTAHMTLPNGQEMKGQLTMLNDGYHVKWIDGPEGKWKITYQPGTFTYIKPDGDAAGTISKIVPGNPENY